MSAEYSVEEVREWVAIAEGQAKLYAGMMGSHEPWTKLAGMLNHLAERIEADESAVSVAWQQKRRPEDYPDEWRECSKETFVFVNQRKESPWIVRELFDNPPAQAAQMDRARETPRRQQAVEMLLELGWTYNSERGWEEPSPTAEPVAQADTDSSAAIGPLAYSYRDCLKEANRPTASIATHPHSPDAADSGRVTEAMVEQAFQAMDAVFAVEFPNRYDGLSDADKAIACKGIRAALEAALAAQSQGDSDGMCNEDHPERRCICREEFGHRVCGTTPPASPAGVPDEVRKALGTLATVANRVPAPFITAAINVIDTWLNATSATPEGGEAEL